MSEVINKTTALLVGTREAIIRVLNRAFRMCSSGECKPPIKDDLFF